jgi:hypothetical protein
MVEVDFNDGSEQGFRKVKESLERMGVANNKKRVIYQSVHILHKHGRYYICHFLEMFALDGRRVEMTQEDLSRRNFIVKLLKEWNLIVPINDDWQTPMGSSSMVKVLKFGERDDWELVPKYDIGSKKERY